MAKTSVSKEGSLKAEAKRARKVVKVCTINRSAEDLFRRAGREYLTGNWIKAEQLLTHLIRLNGRDVDAQLMLAGLLRRTGQLTEASARLRRLEATDGAEKWRSEIRRERQWLEQLFQNPKRKTSEVQDTPPQDDNSEAAMNQAA